MIELWKDIAGYECFYKVSNMGRVASIGRVVTRPYRGGIRSQKIKSLVLKGSTGNHGYPVASLCKNGHREERTIHRLMAIAFFPNYENKPFINHKDGVKTNNRISNFEWCDCLYNNQHAKENNLNARGEKMGSAKLKEVQVIEIRQLLAKGGISQTEIGKMFGVSGSVICIIGQRKSWTHI